MVKHSDSKRIGVDTTVQGKAVSYPMGSKFLNRSRERLNSLCQEHEVVHRHRYVQIGAKALCKANQYTPMPDSFSDAWLSQKAAHEFGTSGTGYRT